MRGIRSRSKAQERWDKLRRYVMYRWGCSILDNRYKTKRKDSGCNPFMVQSVRGNGSSHKRTRLDTISYNRKSSVPGEKAMIVKSETVPNCEGTSNSKASESEIVSTAKGRKQISESGGAHVRDHSQSHAYSLANDVLPPLPKLELKDGSQMDLSDIHRNIQSLYDYNVMLREKFIAAQSLIHDLATNHSYRAKDG